MKSNFSHTKYSEEFICDKKLLEVGPESIAQK